MVSYLPYVGFVQFPRQPHDLTSAACPACGTPRVAAACAACGLDLIHPSMAELDAASMDAAASLDRRLEIIGRIRYETDAARALATAARAAAVPAAVHSPTTLVRPAVVNAGAGPVATLADSGTVENGIPSPPAPRRAIGVQVVLLVVGVGLLSVGAIFFLVYAFITFGLVWRSVIIAAVTVGAIVGATLLRRRRLTVGAEAIAMLGVVFVLLDAFALRANDFGFSNVEGRLYWGPALIVISVGFLLWARISSLRAPSIVAFSIFAPGVATLVSGIFSPVDEGTAFFAGAAGLAVAGFAYPVARGRGVETFLSLGLAIVGTVGAGFASLFVSFDSPGASWASSVALGILGVVSLVHVFLARSTVARAPLAARPGAKVNGAVVGPAGLIFASLGSIAVGSAVLAGAVRTGGDVLLVTAPTLAAVVVTLVLEGLLWMPAESYTRRVAIVAAWSAGAVAALTLLISLAAIVPVAVQIALGGIQTWSVAADSRVDWGSSAPAALGTLAAVVVLATVAWWLGGTLRSRRAVVISGAIGILILGAPLIGPLWLVIGAWLLISAVGVATLRMGAALPAVSGRSSIGAGPGLRVPVAVGSAVATTFAYAASWASAETWWYASVGVIAILVAARFTTGSVIARAALIAVASVVFLIGAGATGWQADGRWRDGPGGGTDSVHFVVGAAVLLLGVTLTLGRRALAAPERAVIFWVAFLSGGIGAALSWLGEARVLGGEFGPPQHPEEVVAQSLTVVLAFAFVAVAAAWALAPTTRGLPGERIAASVAVAPLLSWALALFAALVGLPRIGEYVAPVSAAIIVTSLSLAASVLKRGEVPRWARDIGAGVVITVSVVAPFSVGVPSISGGEAWLIFLFAGIAVVPMAVSSDGLFGSASPRRFLGWAALGLAFLGLVLRLQWLGVSEPEPYVLPLAGMLLLIAFFVARAQPAGADPGAPTATAPTSLPALIAFVGLTVGIVPVALASVSGPVERTIAVGLVSAGLLLVGSWGRGAMRPYWDAAAFAGGIGVAIAGFGRAASLLPDGQAGSVVVDLWVAATTFVLIVSTVGLGERTAAAAAAGAVGAAASTRERSRRAASEWLLMGTLGAAALVELAAIGRNSNDSGALDTARAVAVLVALGSVHVIGVLVREAPTTARVGWISIFVAALFALWSSVGAGAIAPVEWATGLVAVPLLLVGAVKLRRDPDAGSWPWLAPGIVVLLLPSLAATFVFGPPVWRLVGLGVACIVAIVVGAVGRLQSPLIIGSAVVLVHAIRTFAPQIISIYQSTQWWVWAVIGGAVVIFIAVTFERRVRDFTAVGLRVGALR